MDATASSNSVWHAAGGTLRRPRVTVFKGVPYAKPPVGALRWRLPQPVEPWDGVRMADHFPPIGWQDQPGVDADDFWTRELNPRRTSAS